MGTERAVLIVSGEKEPTDGLVEQAGKSLETGKLHKEKLLAFGFTEVKFTELEMEKAKVSAALAARKNTQEGSKGDTRGQAAAIAELKDHFCRLNTILPIVIRDLSPEGIDVNSFAPHGRLGNSAKKLVGHADRTRSLVVQLNDAFTPYFNGKSPIGTHDELRKAVEAGNSKQESNRETSPEQTADLNAAKGRMLELIDDLNRVGRVAFMGQAEIAAKFNKDILLRARRQGRSKPAAVPATPAEPAGL